MARTGASISATGVRKAMQRLQAVGDASLDQSSTMDDLADEAPGAITKVAHDTGRLEASLKHGAAEQYRKVTDDGYEIGSTVWYAHMVFGGTKTMRARKPRVARKRLTERAAGLLARNISSGRH